MDEFARIRHWTAGRQSLDLLRTRGVDYGIGDDAAVLDIAAAADGISGEKRLLVAMDTMVESVHFAEVTMRDDDIGYKALAANVSDIAAMGGVPLAAFVSVSVPQSYSADRMRKVYDGLYSCAERYSIAVAGGDTTSSPGPLVISVTLTGTVEAGKELLRSGARPGDAVFLTGPIGLSGAGLHFLQAKTANSGVVDDAENEAYRSMIAAHRTPRPSVAAGRLLLQSGACTSLNDVSDGLASEAWEIAEASGLRLVLSEGLLPKSGSLSAYASIARKDPLEWMLYGGEDYVLLGTIASQALEVIKAAFSERGLPFYVIGKTEDGEPDVQLERLSENWSGGGSVDRKELNWANGATNRISLQKRGYNHFGK
ncbi:thiamine-phosphate kinase [Paenibacillus sp. GCM10027627]|uniref:thiamine-phosphate kinase n=1 Tax=unclassified Paenibacillus TaxID=185978 RepID=UPI00362A4E1B